MAGFRMLIPRFLGMFRKERREADLNEEVRTHLEMLAEENVRKGMNQSEARYAALRSFGGVEQGKESYREQHGLVWLEMKAGCNL